MLEEVDRAIDSLKNNKVPGPVGLAAEYYKIYRKESQTHRT